MNCLKWVGWKKKNTKSIWFNLLFFFTAGGTGGSYRQIHLDKLKRASIATYPGRRPSPSEEPYSGSYSAPNTQRGGMHSCNKFNIWVFRKSIEREGERICESVERRRENFWGSLECVRFLLHGVTANVGVWSVWLVWATLGYTFDMYDCQGSVCSPGDLD